MNAHVDVANAPSCFASALICNPEPAAPKPMPPATATMPLEFQNILREFKRAKVMVRGKLTAGENPFPKKPVFLRIACYLLLGMPNGLPRELLRTAYMMKLNWPQDKAHALMLKAIQALLLVEAVEEVDGRLRIKRTK